MGGNNNRFFTWYSNDEIKTLIAKYGTDIKEELTKKIKAESLSSVQPAITTTIYDQEIKEWKLRKLKAETLLKERELQYENTFGSAPSPEARQAMREMVSYHASVQKPEGASQSWNLSPSQWDFVYGSMSYGYGKVERKICAVEKCGFECEKDETIRKHIIDNHDDKIKTLLVEIRRLGIK